MSFLSAAHSPVGRTAPVSAKGAAGATPPAMIARYRLAKGIAHG